MHVEHLRVTTEMRDSVPGTPITFGHLAMFRDEVMSEYMTHVFALMGEGQANGHSPAKPDTEAWLQDNGELLVVIPGFDGAHRTMIVPKGKWRLMSEDELRKAPKPAEVLEQVLSSDAAPMVEAFFKDNLESATDYAAWLQREREAYDREHPRGGIVILSKSREGLLGLESFGENYSFLASTVRKFAADHSKHFLLLFFSNEHHRTSSYAFSNLEELLGGGMQALAKEIGGDIRRVGIGTSLGDSDVRAIMEKWEEIGGGRPFGKPPKRTP